MQISVSRWVTYVSSHGSAIGRCVPKGIGRRLKEVFEGSGFWKIPFSMLSWITMQPNDRFCPHCAATLEIRESGGAQRPVCPACGRVIYFDPKVAATAVVGRGGSVLLIRRGNQPGYGQWSMPGGYVDRGEVVEEAAAREVWEETGLRVEIEGLVGLFSERGHPVIVAAFAARELGGTLAAGDEALDLGFFPLDALPDLAFPRDRLILERWLEWSKCG